MHLSGESGLTIANALPAYRWNADYTDKVIGKITPEIFDWRPPSPDGSWQFALGEIAAHIADVAHLFWAEITDNETGRTFFMRSPGPASRGAWSRNREFELSEVLAELSEARQKWEEILNWPIDSAYIPTQGTIKVYKKFEQLAADGKYPADKLAYGPETPISMIATLISHEACHRGALIAYLRAYHGISPE